MRAGDESGEILPRTRFCLCEKRSEGPQVIPEITEPLPVWIFDGLLAGSSFSENHDNQFRGRRARSFGERREGLVDVVDSEAPRLVGPLLLEMSQAAVQEFLFVKQRVKIGQFF